tara:strand:- start:129 stop:1184 length:1056 start_codon:yes stop_codon:yes gene_type:complete
MINSRLPVTIVTGFLGSGKTTLLRHLLVKSKKRLAVMINEFGDIGLDGDLIRSCQFCPEEELECRLIELNNGCLCCTVQEDFLPTMEKLLNVGKKLDGIVIETSGLALPMPLLKALEWPSIKSKVHINGVVTLVDGEALSSGSPVCDINLIEKQRKDDPNLDHLSTIDELFKDQLKCADLILLSRSDLISKDQIAEISKDLSTKARDCTRLIPVSKGNIDPEIILGIDRITVKEFDNLIISNDRNGHDHDHEHLEIKSHIMRIEVSLEKNKLEASLVEFVKKYHVIRLKGRCWLEGKTIPLQIQMVGPRINTWYESVPGNSWKPINNGIELIILSLDERAGQSCDLFFQNL